MTFGGANQCHFCRCVHTQINLLGVDPNDTRQVPVDFKPFIPFPGDELSVSENDEGLLFMLSFLFFAGRHWDLLYATLFFTWTVLAPLYQPDIDTVDPSAGAVVLRVMASCAVIPTIGLLLQKGFWEHKLQRTLAAKVSTCSWLASLLFQSSQL